MKTFVKCLFASAALAVISWNSPIFAQDVDDFDADFSSGQNLCSVLTINADGTCQFVSTEVETRSAAEGKMHQWDRFKAMSENPNTDEDGNPLPAAPVTSTNEDKPFSDAELVQKVTAIATERTDDPGQTNVVTVTSNTVTVVATSHYASLEEMLQRSRAVWTAGGMSFANVRLETDTNQLLRMTLTPPPGMQRYQKRLRAQWKLAGLKAELKLVFPGRVVASGFPATQTNATWLAMDSQNDESLNALEKLYSGPVVITAESSGLKLAQPLDAEKLWRSRSQNEDEDTNTLPITAAGPGFVAEAQSLATTTLHVFPGGEKYLPSTAAPTGTVISVKLFAPKGRFMKSVSNVRILAAVDNQGRSLLDNPNDNDDSLTEAETDTPSGGSSDPVSVSVTLHLPVPPPDAQSIDHLAAEAVAITIGTWKEMTLTNLSGSLSNELDLSTVLPGARLTLTKITSKSGQFVLQANITGPAAVNNLDARLKFPEVENFNSSSYNTRAPHNQNGQTTRNLTIQGYGYGSDGPLSLSASNAVLTIRQPDDLKRERVKFELKTLDLY